uniref:Mitochondrial nucleoid factor 1 n=1 Tax=Oncorhynchus tshawytscha TaxID=74940 RepID=A0AAZ3QI93_ONCTS
MSVARYRQFLKLCEEWPRDESKKGRDLGTFLRQRVTHAFREGENTQLSDPEKCDQIYESLARINTNVYRERFPRTRDTSFTGVTVEECRMLLATGAVFNSVVSAATRDYTLHYMLLHSAVPIGELVWPTTLWLSRCCS